MRAEWRGHELARSDDTTEVDGYTYFPVAAVDMSLLEPSDHRTRCYWKGEAHYFDVVAGGERQRNAGWTYPSPSQQAIEAGIEGRIAFWKDVTVEP